MNVDLLQVNSRSVAAKMIIVAAVVVAILFAWIAVRMQIGNMFADLTPATDPNSQEVADFAISMSPNDPMTAWLKASVSKSTFSLSQSEETVKLFERTVQIAPNDYRWWIELGRAREQIDKASEAEAALLNATKLAPANVFLRWQLGNFYLRQDRPDEAFVALRLATAKNHVYRDQVFSLAWDYFEKDVSKLEANLVTDTSVYPTLAMFYSVRGRAADAVRVWGLLNDEQKAEYPQFSRVMAQGLYDKRFFAQSIVFANQSDFDPDAKPFTVSNAGFEASVGLPESTLFGWKVTRTDSKLELAADQSVKHSGSKSMRISFKGYAKPELYNLFQTVVVEPSTQYKLKFWVRTESLKSGGGPQLEIINANDDKLIATSRPYPQGTNDWQEFVIDITTPENCDGITIRTARAYCGENCPIVGTIWYDDFVLTK